MNYTNDDHESDNIEDNEFYIRDAQESRGLGDVYKRQE